MHLRPCFAENLGRHIDDLYVDIFALQIVITRGQAGEIGLFQVLNGELQRLREPGKSFLKIIDVSKNHELLLDVQQPS